jgi:hypothetical protein
MAGAGVGVDFAAGIVPRPAADFAGLLGIAAGAGGAVAAVRGFFVVSFAARVTMVAQPLSLE